MSTRSLTLEQLIALNDELAAITRMGVPLEIGLRGLGQELPGHLGAATESLHERLSSGQDLATALSESADDFPPTYRAIVLAGSESGQLSSALQCVAESARRVNEVRRSVRIACFYPLLVLAVAYTVFVLFTVYWVPVLLAFYEHSTFSTLPIFTWLTAISNTAVWWAPLLPVLVSLPLAAWYRGSRRSALHPLRELRHSAQVAAFTDLLASMIEHAVPLHRALALAADASGNAAIQTECRLWAEHVEHGESIPLNAGLQSAVPTWIAWLLQHSHGQAQLARNLRQAAEVYHNDVVRKSRWLARVLPLWLTMLGSGTITLVTAAFVVGPWFYVLFQLGSP